MVDIVELKKSDFWKKKIRRAVVARDTNKSGSITRSDFEMLIEHYKKNARGTTEKIETMSKTILTFCDKVGLVDHSKMLSYDEFEEYLLAFLCQNAFLERFRNLFRCLDANGDNCIDLTEWKLHNASMGIPPEHAENSFNAMDTDEDGKVTEDEFVSYHAEYFHTTENKLNSAILYGPL